MATQTGARWLDLKVPPAVLVMIAALLIWVGAAYLPEFGFQFRFQSILGWVVGVLGFVGCFLGFLEFRRSRTTLNPTKPRTSSSLVQSGIYRYTRNPMYLGFLLMLGAWAMVMGNVISFLVLPGFVIYLNRFQIQPEERALSSIFGDEFTAYRAAVRRWI